MPASLATPREEEMKFVPQGSENSDSQQSRHWLRQLAWSTAFLTILASLTVIYYARAILLPIVLAIILNLVFKPIVVRAERLHIRPSWSAAVILLVVLVVIGVGFTLLWNPATSWFSDLPAIRSELAQKLRPLLSPVEKLNEASEEVEKMTNVEDEDSPIRVQVEQPGITSFIVNSSGTFLASSVLTIALFYFLLAGGDHFLEKSVSIMPRWKDKKNIVELTRAIQQNISTYLFTITCVNIGLGIVIGITMGLLQLPNPALWGVMAFLLNFVPFVGAACGAVIVFVVALLEYELSYSLLAPLFYIIINSVEANLVTPYMLGRTMKLDPVAILLSITLWGWMWGIGGVFLAVPILVVFKIACDHLESMAPVGKLLE